MTKNDLITLVYNCDTDLTKKSASKIVDNIFKSIKDTIKEKEKFSYPGFGTLVLRNRKARRGRDPRTGLEIKIKASKTVGFRPAKAFKEQL